MNIDTIDLNFVYNVASDLLTYSNDSSVLEEKIKLFENAVVQQYETIQRTNFNPSDDVDKEIRTMQEAIGESNESFVHKRALVKYQSQSGGDA